MPAMNQPLAVRLACWLLACALRHWPEETREWGMALAAEIDETTKGVEALRWSLGGIMFFLRSVLSSAFAWLKLPAGASLSAHKDSGAMGPSIVPKRSRLFVAVVLAAAGVLLFMPQGREAVATVRASWSGYAFGRSATDQRDLEKLAIRAEKDHDGATLAFVALSVDDPERAASLADHAVSLNPDMVWIYGGLRIWPAPPASRGRQLERLQAADPENAFPYLLAADDLERPLWERWPRPDQKAVEAAMANDPKWIALMVRAFAAPRYDSYFSRHFELTKRMWSREKYLSPSFALRGFYAHALPNLMTLRKFAEIANHRAEKAFAAGNAKDGARLFEQVEAFGERVANGDSSTIEKFVGLGIAHDASEKLGKLYAGAGLAAEADKFVEHAKQLEMRQRGLTWRRWSDDPARRDAFKRWGFLVQCFAGLAVLAAAMALVGVLLLELLPLRLANRRIQWRRAICWTADYAPLATPVASVAFLLSFLPSARAFAAYRTADSPLAGEQLIEPALWGLSAIPSYVTGVRFLVPMWYAITLALAALAVFVIARSIYRARHFPVSHT